MWHYNVSQDKKKTAIAPLHKLHTLVQFSDLKLEFMDFWKL